MLSNAIKGPLPTVAIGGLGGSGTRVFAALLESAGVRIGEALNEQLDNLWFTVLFKRQAWTESSLPEDGVETSLRLFCQAMTHGLDGSGLNPADRRLLEGLRAQLPPHGRWRCGANALHADSLMSSGPHGNKGQPWGWKEPNTHIFLPHLDRLIPGFRYIHVVRNGLDMAFSGNTWQARHWSHLYPVDCGHDDPLPVRQLRYWAAANRAALDYGARHMRERFLVMSYESMCSHPEVHWRRLLRFLGQPADKKPPEDLVRPTSIGRSEQHDLSVFRATDLEIAQALQEEVARLGQSPETGDSRSPTP